MGFVGFVGFMGLMGFYGSYGLGPTNPFTPSNPSLLSAIPAHPLLAGAVHLFLDAALLLEVVLLPFNQSADEDIALVDEGDGNVGNGFGRALLDFFAIDGRVEVSLAEGACLHTSGGRRRAIVQGRAHGGNLRSRARVRGARHG